MNKEFLNRIVYLIVNETIIDYDDERIYLFRSFISTIDFLSDLFYVFKVCDEFLLPTFSQHCKEIYSLNEQEIDYVWNEYRNIIHDKMNKELA